MIEREENGEVAALRVNYVVHGASSMCESGELAVPSKEVSCDFGFSEFLNFRDFAICRNCVL